MHTSVGNEAVPCDAAAQCTYNRRVKVDVAVA